MKKHIEGRIVDLFSRRIFEGELIIENTRIIDIVEKKVDSCNYILPGLIDSHVHIESSMLTPSRFAEMVVPRGTVAVVTDPHEIANVLGEKGVDFMIKDGELVPLKFFFGAPSCVPATPFETSGAVMDYEIVDRLLRRKDIWFLSEMMNFPGVINDVPDVINKCKAAIKYGKPIDGHAPGLMGNDLEKYVGYGISTDHECGILEEAIEKLSLGMKIQIREGSAARNFSSLYPLFSKYADRLMLCTDDSHPDEILNKGHIDRLIRQGRKEYNIDIFDLLKSATVIPVQHYNLPVGLLRKGDFADFIIVDNLDDLNIQATFINGEKVFDNKSGVLFNFKASQNINSFRDEYIDIEDLSVLMPDDKSFVKAIEVNDGELLTNTFMWQPKLDNNKNIISNPDEDIIKLVVVNRYCNKLPVVGFVKNFGLKKGAIGSTVSHDSHNIVVAGVDDNSICSVVNNLIDNKGGIAVCDSFDVSVLSLPIGGLMTSRKGKDVAIDYLSLSNKAKILGCKLKAPFMSLSFLSLLVIPSLKLGDKGLFDVDSFKFVSLFE